MPRGRAAAALIPFVSLLLLCATPARAGTIGFTISSTVDTSAGLALVLELTNNGDETAHGVTPTAEFGDLAVTGERLRGIPPNGTHKWTIPVQDHAPPAGAYVMLVRIAYEDANAYQFDVIAAAPFNVGVTPRRPVYGAFLVPQILGKASVPGNLTLTLPADRGDRFDVRIALPGGVRGGPVKHSVDAADNRRVRLPIRLRNVALLEGTKVNVFALVTSKSEDTPQTDIVRGTVRIGSAAPVVGRTTFTTIAVALALYLVALQLIGGVRKPWKPEPLPSDPFLDGAAEMVLACGASAFLLYHYPWDALLAATTTAGGDMASLYYPTKLLAEEILPTGQVTGWTMGNYAGFPVFHFYSTLPFALIALLGKLIPMEVAFKLVTLSGPTLLPIAAAYLFRALGYGRGAPAIAAVSVLPFLMQQGNSMWGGNIPSVLAGEFCHALGITLSLFYLGVLHRTVEGKRSWPLAAFLLVAIGLSHTFAFFAAVWYSLFFLWPRPDSGRLAPPVLAVFALTFLLLCFWGMPLPTRLIFTTEWSMIWRIKDWKEVLPEPLWPAAWLAGANVVLMLVRLKEFRLERQGLLLFMFAGGVLLYFLVPALGFPDIRFVPISQLFLGLLAADLVYWVGGVFQHRVVFAACVLAAGLAWAQDNLGYIPSWLKWNYAGYEGKPTWELFEKINDHLRGDLNDPRVVFEHSQAHNRFGSSRAFENLPLFSGRSTLEGVFHQASPNSPFIFYLQSEASERGSGPFPQYTYTRLNVDKALPHLRLFNVSHLVVVSDKARKAYDEHPSFEKTFESGTYAVFEVEGGDTGYVVAPRYQPVLYDGPEWKLAFYRWYKHHDFTDVPLVPADMIDEKQAREFALRTDSIKRLPREPYDEDCTVTSHLEQYRISFDTSCPGRPHIVKVSYFPRWKTTDGSPIHLVSPAFMLVYPRDTHFELYYGRTLIDVFGLVVSGAGLLLLIGCASRRTTASRVENVIAAPFRPLLATFERHYFVLSVFFLAIAVAGGALTRYSLRLPERRYQKAQEAYRARDFDKAIELLEAWTAADKETFKQATALYQLGVSYSEIGNHAAATHVHERLRFDFANVNYGAGTLFHLARNYARLGETERAKHYAALLEQEHPDTSWLKRLQKENSDLFGSG